MFSFRSVKALFFIENVFVYVIRRSVTLDQCKFLFMLICLCTCLEVLLDKVRVFRNVFHVEAVTFVNRIGIIWNFVT